MATKLRVLVVDDEPLARERLLRLLSAEAEIEVVGECADGASAAAAIPQLAPDVLFLDVQMPPPNGLQVAAGLPLPQKPAVVFVTAHEDFALDAFDVGAVDYLLKPFDQARFRLALDRAADFIQARNGGERATDRMVVKADGRLVFLRASEIHWAEAADNYVVLHLEGRSLTIRETLSALELRLGTDDFVRINRSALVHLDRLKELRPAEHTDHLVILKDGTQLPLSRGLRSRLVQLIDQR